MTAKLTRRRQLRVNPVHDHFLEEIAERRGCDVSDLYREAALSYFPLPADARETRKTQVKDSEEKAS